jgi:hypothetical protein
MNTTDKHVAENRAKIKKNIENKLNKINMRTYQEPKWTKKIVVMPNGTKQMQMISVTPHQEPSEEQLELERAIKAFGSSS